VERHSQKQSPKTDEPAVAQIPEGMMLANIETVMLAKSIGRVLEQLGNAVEDDRLNLLVRFGHKQPVSFATKGGRFLSDLGELLTKDTVSADDVTALKDRYNIAEINLNSVLGQAEE
jgi:hypothetical protein